MLSTPTFSLRTCSPVLSLSFVSPSYTSSRTSLFCASFACTRESRRNLFSPLPLSFHSLSFIIFYIIMSSSFVLLTIEKIEKRKRREERETKKFLVLFIFQQNLTCQEQVDWCGLRRERNQSIDKIAPN